MMNKRALGFVFVVLVIGVYAMVRYYSNDYVAPAEEAVAANEAAIVAIETGGGWSADDTAHTWTLNSTVTTADADVYVVNIDADVTGYIGPNMKIRLKDGGVTKYFGVLTVGAYSAGVTPLYLFGGTDYVLSGTITEPAYSYARAPIGFSVNPDKWKIEVLDANVRVQSTPTNDVWYNIDTTHKITAPAGEWVPFYEAVVGGSNSTSSFGIFTTLSTANNTEATPEYTQYLSAGMSSGVLGIGRKVVLNTNKHIVLTSDTAYYLNFMTKTTLSDISVYSAPYTTILRFVWGGL